MSEIEVAANGSDGETPIQPLLSYVNGPDSLTKAHALFGGPQGLLRSAAAAIAKPGTGDPGVHSSDPAEQEIRAFADFIQGSGLMLMPQTVAELIQQNFIGKGIEHSVGLLPDISLVIKDYDTTLFDEETGTVFYKPAELLFDYLTDHILANHLFGDAIELVGAYEERGFIHLVVTQPFIEGLHPSWTNLVHQLQGQGMELENPGTTKARFWIDGGNAGPLLVTDVHEDNVVISRSGMAHPIDVHFSFPGRQARLDALNALGIL